MAKKGGFLDKALHGVLDELMDDDGKKTTADAPAPAATAAPAPAPSGTMPYPFGTTPSAAPAPSAAGAPTFAPGVPEPIDPKVLDMVSSGVFIDITDGTKSRPSRYMLFSKMWETLGRPQNAMQPLSAMQVSDPTMTAGAVLQDIDAHLSMLDGVAASAESDFEAAAATKLGGADSQLTTLQQANEAAVREIERHQKEITERSAQAAAIQTQRQLDEAAIANAKAKTAAAVDSVRTQLTGARNLFASLS